MQVLCLYIYIVADLVVKGEPHLLWEGLLFEVQYWKVTKVTSKIVCVLEKWVEVR